jgi:hypothetical protein
VLLSCCRNDSFKGKVSVIGHSLGSLIVFDILSHQSPAGLPAQAAETEARVAHTENQAPTADPHLTLEQVSHFFVLLYLFF